jgi:hypothetical protein
VRKQLEKKNNGSHKEAKEAKEGRWTIDEDERRTELKGRQTENRE